MRQKYAEMKKKEEKNEKSRVFLHNLSDYAVYLHRRNKQNKKQNEQMTMNRAYWWWRRS